MYNVFDVAGDRIGTIDIYPPYGVIIIDGIYYRFQEDCIEGYFEENPLEATERFVPDFEP